MNVLTQDLTVPVESKRELAKAKTRRALLKSALRLYSLEGAQGMSMNKIAKGAGIAQPSFYNHFESLEALQNELSAQLKDNYLSPMRLAWVNMLKDYDLLSKDQFNQQCRQCLIMIFDSSLMWSFHNCTAIGYTFSLCWRMAYSNAGSLVFSSDLNAG